MKKILALLPAVLLTGCQMFNYQEPGGEDTATVTFTGDTAAQPAVCVPGKGFKDTREAIAVKPWETNAFNELFKTMRKAEQVAVPVVADGRTRVGVVYNERRDSRSQTQGRDHCRVAVQFDAQPGEHYRAHFTRNDAGQCGLDVRGEDDARADAVPVDWACPN